MTLECPAAAKKVCRVDGCAENDASGMKEKMPADVSAHAMPAEPLQPPVRTRSGLIQDAEQLLATLDANLTPLERFRTSSEAERAAAAAARTQEEQWLSHEAEQARQLAEVTSAAAALTAELDTAARQMRSAQQPPVQQQPVQQPPVRQRQRTATREKDKWVSGAGAAATPRQREPEWRRHARLATQEREAAEAAEAAPRSVHRRKLSKAEQEHRFEELQQATTRSARKRLEAREREEARRSETLKRQQVHFAKKANWSSLLDRLYVPPTPSARRGLASLGSVAQPSAQRLAQQSAQRPSSIPVRSARRTNDGEQQPAWARSVAAAPLPPQLLEPHEEEEEEARLAADINTETQAAARQALLDWDLATTVETLTAELEEREAELAQQHDAVDDLLFKLRAVCREGLRHGIDLEAWLEDSWDQIEEEGLQERERDTPRARGETVELRRREFIAQAEAEQRRRSFLAKAGPALGLEPYAELVSPVITTGMQAHLDSQRELRGGSPPAE
jgi:hypothetical protein